MKQKAPFRAGGFTMIEMLLVVLLLAVISGLAVPYIFQSIPSFQIKTAAGDLAYSIRYAQTRALMKNRMVRLVFDADFRSYKMEDGSGESADIDRETFVPVSGRMGRPASLPDTLEIIDGPDQVVCYPDGQIEKVRFDICRTNSKNCLTISTSDQRGEVSVYSPDE
jgi:prepilin-type N-terminal cleavage/methylation domain-containing protein